MRSPPIYLERCRLSTLNNQVISTSSGTTKNIAVASHLCLMIGPGVSVSSQVFRTAAKYGCPLIFVYGDRSRVCAASADYRNGKYRIEQIKRLNHGKTALRLIKYILATRMEFAEIALSKDYSYYRKQCRSVTGANDGLLLEARFMKHVYQDFYSQGGLNRAGPDFNELKMWVNTYFYASVNAAIIGLGLEPALGVLHGVTRGGGLVFDVADLFKTLFGLRLMSFAQREGLSRDATFSELHKMYRRCHLNELSIGLLQYVCAGTTFDQKRIIAFASKFLAKEWQSK